MFKTIDETLAWIHGFLPHGMKPGTQRVEWMLERCGNPERRIKTIHVGGTNGKGSTVCYLRTIYQEAGLKVGSFISPYITSFNERISVNGEGIPDEDLIATANAVKPLVDEVSKTELGSPTEFEVITVMAFYYFCKINWCDLVIFEVGLGGRLDSTNVIFPLATVITSIGMDHTKQLGNRIEDIAYEKSGIIKPGIPVITGVEQEEAFSVIEKTAKSKQAKLYRLNEQFHILDKHSEDGSETFSYKSYFTNRKDLKIHLLGEHQIRNAALALMVVDVLYYFYAIAADEEAVKRGLARAFWPGRFEKVSDKPLIILDGAHNAEGVAALIQTAKEHYPEHKIKILYAAMQDKDNTSMIHALDTIADTICFTHFDFKRTAKAEELMSISHHQNKSVTPNWKDALKSLINEYHPGELILVTGSLYFISEVREYLLHNN